MTSSRKLKQKQNDSINPFAMLNNEEPSNNFQQLYDEVKKYIELQTEYVKVEFVEKLTILFSTILIIGLIIILAITALFYFSFSMAYLLEPVLGSIALSFGIVSGVFVLLILLLFLFRKRIIIIPVVKFLSKLLLKKTNK
jgi:hypothetical protein